MQCKDVTPIIAELVRLKNSIPLEIDVGRYLPEVRKNTHGEAVRSGLKKALRVIEQAPVVDAMPRWISVEERLPEGEVLAANFTPSAFGYRECIIGYVSPPSPTIPDGYYAENEFELLQGVTHWMPLPQLPKEE